MGSFAMNEKWLVLDRKIQEDLGRIVLLKAMQLRPIYRQQIERFLEHVNSLE